MMNSKHDTVISDNTVFAARKDDQIFRELDGEAVILNIQTNTYCGLNSVGTRIWQIIQEPTSVADIQSILLDEYNVDSKRCKKELLDVLKKMAELKIVEISIDSH